MSKFRVGLELGRTAVELADVAEDDSGAAMHGLHEAADVDVGVAVLLQLADFFAIFPEANDCEAA